MGGLVVRAFGGFVVPAAAAVVEVTASVVEVTASVVVVSVVATAGVVVVAVAAVVVVDDAPQSAETTKLADAPGDTMVNVAAGDPTADKSLVKHQRLNTSCKVRY